MSDQVAIDSPALPKSKKSHSIYGSTTIYDGNLQSLKSSSPQHHNQQHFANNFKNLERLHVHQVSLTEKKVPSQNVAHRSLY